MIQQVIHGEALEELRKLPSNSIDAICADPPAGIGFMLTKERDWDSDKGGRDKWVAWLAEIMAEALRVLKPGGHALIWSLPRTSHWTAYALENAGFEIKDSIEHVFGSGFPKSHNVSVAIDKLQNAEREIVGRYTRPDGSNQRNATQGFRVNYVNGDIGSLNGETPITKPATPEAEVWDGWGSALKPAHETWWLCRKPLAESSIAAQVLATGTGAINIDASRIGNDVIKSSGQASLSLQKKCVEHGIREYKNGLPGADYPATTHTGRWPSNILFSHSIFCTQDGCAEDCPVRLLDEQSGVRKSGGRITKPDETPTYGVTPFSRSKDFQMEPSEGGASRFFYCPKPSRSERNRGCEALPVTANRSAYSDMDIRECNVCGSRAKKGNIWPSCGHDDWKWVKTFDKGHTGGLVHNNHPTVKSISLMKYLVRMITPPGGVVLDMFGGSGTTALACIEEGFGYILVEREQEYIDIIQSRINHAISAINKEVA